LLPFFAGSFATFGCTALVVAVVDVKAVGAAESLANNI
jgi:hypothetical protein